MRNQIPLPGESKKHKQNFQYIPKSKTLNTECHNNVKHITPLKIQTHSPSRQTKTQKTQNTNCLTREKKNDARRRRNLLQAPGLRRLETRMEERGGRAMVGREGATTLDEKEEVSLSAIESSLSAGVNSPWFPFGFLLKLKYKLPSLSLSFSLFLSFHFLSPSSFLLKTWICLILLISLKHGNVCGCVPHYNNFFYFIFFDFFDFFFIFFTFLLTFFFHFFLFF